MKTRHQSRQRATWIYLGLFLCVVTILLIPRGDNLTAEELPQAEPRRTNSTNLLLNPSFEGQYSTYIPPGGHPDCPFGVCQTAQMASNWTPWWKSHDPNDPGHIIRMPEYKPAAPFENRIRSGENAQQYFTFYSTHRAGMLQRVKVDAGCTYQFSIWGHSWSSTDDDPGTSDEGFPLRQKVGIDPYGDTDWTSTDIEWGDARYQPNEFGQFTVTAVAFAEHITVFTYSEPEWAAKHNDVYWDDAHLSKQGSDCNTTMTVSPDTEIELVASLEEPKDLSQTIHIDLPNNPGITWQAEIEPGATLTPTLSASSGSPAEDLVVTVDSSGLFVGTYSAELTISSRPRLHGSPVTIPIGLVVDGEMSVSPGSGIAFLVLDSEPQVMSQTINIDLPNHESISWETELKPGGTLTPTLSATSGSAVENLEVTVDSSGKTIGTYSAEVAISSIPQLPGSPVNIPIKLVVTDHIYRFYFPRID